MRTLQMRRLRLPKPQVKRGGQALTVAEGTGGLGGPGGASGRPGRAHWLGRSAAGLRDIVRQELVARQLDEQLAERFRPATGRRLRVLDIGLGQGTQALRLAPAGHRVTGLESDPAMLPPLRAALAAEPDGVRERLRVVEGDGRETGVHFLPGASTWCSATAC